MISFFASLKNTTRSLLFKLKNSTRTRLSMSKFITPLLAQINGLNRIEGTHILHKDSIKTISEQMSILLVEK